MLPDIRVINYHHTKLRIVKSNLCNLSSTRFTETITYIQMYTWVARWMIFTPNWVGFLLLYWHFYHLRMGVQFWAGFRILSFLQECESKSKKIKLVNGKP